MASKTIIKTSKKLNPRMAQLEEMVQRLARDMEVVKVANISTRSPRGRAVINSQIQNILDRAAELKKVAAQLAAQRALASPTASSSESSTTASPAMTSESDQASPTTSSSNSSDENPQQ